MVDFGDFLFKMVKMVDFPANHVSFYWRVLYMLKNNHLNDVMVCKYCSHNHETVD